MPRRVQSLLREGEPGEGPTPLSYETMLKDLARQALERRPRYNYAGRPAREVRARIAQVKRALRRCLGLAGQALPTAPTRVATRRAVRFDGFSITPVAMQRGAGWYVTAHLYVPHGLRQPAPAVMHVHGHSFTGKSGAAYARRCRGLARRGFVVLFVDFPEADERAGTGHALWYPVLADMPVQGIMVADNMAALSFLAGLPFVDGARIGVTGSSGGGNQTVYFCAVDDRVAAAAPCNAPCLIAEHANSGSGAYCHCEAVPGLVAAGVEYHDLLAAMAPKPVRVFTGIRDPLFPVIGARQAVAEANAAYAALGAEGGCTLEEHYCEHECPAGYRQGVYEFFERALKQPGDVDGPGDEGEDIDLSDPRLRALPRRPKRFLRIADLYRAKLRSVRPSRPQAERLNRLLGRAASSSEARCLVRAEGRRWLKALLQTGDGALVPVIAGKVSKRPVVLAMADGGKEEAAARAGSSGGSVAAFDWRGQGETSPAQDQWHQRAAHYTAIGGEPLPGGRVTDLLAVVRWLRAEGRAPERVVAFGPEASMVALLAAAVETRCPVVELHGLARSLRDAPGLVGQVPYTAWLPGLALYTDIPQMVSALGDRVIVRSWLKPGEEAPAEGYT